MNSKYNSLNLATKAGKESVMDIDEIQKFRDEVEVIYKATHTEFP